MNIMMCMMRIHAFANEQRIRGSHSFIESLQLQLRFESLSNPSFREVSYFFSAKSTMSNQESFFRPVALSIHLSVHSVAIGDHHPMISHMFLLEKNVERLRRLRVMGVPP